VRLSFVWVILWQNAIRKIGDKPYGASPIIIIYRYKGDIFNAKMGDSLKATMGSGSL
jgi:hypothetical protein